MHSPTKPTTTIEDLPVEMINELFGYLPLNDLLACSLVNKRWHAIYAAFKWPPRLVVVSEKSRKNRLYKWSYPDRKITEKELLYLKKLDGLPDQPLFSNLKYLALCGWIKFDLNKLNVFGQLEHLELYSVTEYSFSVSRKEEVHWSLPKLRVLVIRGLINAPLTIDCPELSVLIFWDHYRNLDLKVDVKHPETIRTLGAVQFSSQFAKFSNVECFVTGELNQASRSALLSFPKLNEFHYLPTMSDEIVLDGMKEMLKEFLVHAKRRGRTDFRFQLIGIPLSHKSLNEIDFGDQELELKLFPWQSIEYLHMKNYHLIGPNSTLDFVDEVNYSTLLRFANDGIPKCYFNKFPNLQSISTDRPIQDVSHFLWFLKSVNSLETLCLGTPRLGAEFYDHLPDAAPHLQYFQLTEHTTELPLNFDSILQHSLHSLPELRNITLFIEPEMPFELLESLVRWFSKSRASTFHFTLKSKHIILNAIRKEERNSKVRLELWPIGYEGPQSHMRMSFETENLDELFNCLRGMPRKKSNFSRFVCAFILFLVLLYFCLTKCVFTVFQLGGSK